MDAPTSAHPTDQTLHAYGLGKLDDASAERVDAHLESCAACRRRTAEVSSDSFLNRFRDGRSSPDLGSNFGRPSPSPQVGPTADTIPPGLADHVDYEIVRELGRGGMGVVYLVRNRLMDRQEVLKVMARHLVERPEVSERFLREIRSVAALKHPNIVSAYHAFHVGGSIAFTMEYVDGYDLSKMVKARGPLPVPHACLFAHQTALGLQHAHEEGMVHRDIKPGNLMVTRRGTKATVKILDFGLAKAAREGTFDSALTHAGQMLGTPDYIAPEQSVNAQNADIRADIYSLGCTLYYLLSGGPPFHAISLYDLLQAHHSIDAKLLNLLRPEVPTELAALVAKMMAKDPERRFQTPGEIATALAPFFKRGGVVVPNPADAEAPKTSTLGRNLSEAGASPPTAASTQPQRQESLNSAGSRRPEEMWASLIDIAQPEFVIERAIAKPASSGATRTPRRASWPAIAAAAVFGILALGIIISIKIGKDDFELTVRRDRPGEAKSSKVDGEAKQQNSGSDSSIGARTRESPDAEADDRAMPSDVSSKGEATEAGAGFDARDPAVRPAAEEETAPRPIFVGEGSGAWSNERVTNGSSWSVTTEGVLEGQGSGVLGGTAVLATDRKNFANFRLSMEVLNTDTIPKALEIRRITTGNARSGYAICISGADSALGVIPIGSIEKMDDLPNGSPRHWTVTAEPSEIAANEWFRMDIEAVESRITTRVNGKKIAELADPTGSYKSGQIAVYASSAAKISLRNVRVEEITRAPKPTGTGSDSSNLGRHTGRTSPNRPKSLSTRSSRSRAASDTLRSGSVWKGPKIDQDVTNEISLRILERQGEGFSGKLEFADGREYKVLGSTAGREITFRTLLSDYDQFQQSFHGELEDFKMSLQFTGVGPAGAPKQGTAKLELQK